MFKLVVLNTVLAVAASSGIHGVAYTVPTLPAAVSHQSRVDYISNPVVTSFAANPVIKTAEVVATNPVVKTTYTAGPPITHYTAVPVTGTAYTKNVHYAQRDVVTGYTSQIYKPNLGSLTTPIQPVSQQQVHAPARAVQIITPTVTRVEPEITVEKLSVEVPVQTPVVSQVEVRTPIVASAPIAKVVTAVPSVTSYSYSVSAPAVSHATVAVTAAPVAKVAPVGSAPTSYSYHIQGSSVAVDAAPAAKVAAAAPVVNSYSYSVATPTVTVAPVAKVTAAPVAKVTAATPTVSEYSLPISAPAVAKVTAVSSSSHSISTPAKIPVVSGYSYSVAAPIVAKVAAIPAAPSVAGYSYSISAPALAAKVVSINPAVSGYSYSVAASPEAARATSSASVTDAEASAWRQPVQQW